MKKGLLALGALFAICLSMLATDMVVKQKNGEDWKINVDDVEEVFFEEKANIPDDSTVVDASETFLLFKILTDSTAEILVDLSERDSENINIPAKVRIDGNIYTVTNIAECAFCERILDSVKIPSTVTKIEERAFVYFTNITVAEDNPAYSSLNDVLYDKDKTEIIRVSEVSKGDFEIPSSVKSIGEYAFYDCLDLTSIKIPEGVTRIGKKAFSYCDSLTNINIPDGVTSIKDGVFEGCSNLTNISIPDGVTGIGDYAFYRCRSLTSISIPEEVRSIGKFAFEGCSKLDITVNNSKNNVEVGTDAFEGCKSVTWLKE